MYSIKSVMILFLMYFNFLFPQTKITSPKDFFGFEPGANKNLFNYEKLIDYLKLLESQSEKIKLVKIGDSPFNKPIYVAFISNQTNIKNLDRLKQINKELALNYSLDETKQKSLVSEGKIFLLATLSMHSEEVGPTQVAPLTAYNLITNTNPLIDKYLDEVVLMMVPCHNPDGMKMVVEHYNKYKNTKYETSSMPGVYHKYVGHDNNRDFVILSQKDNKAIASIYNTEWFPQVMVEKHQMGKTGVRYFVPPMHDPIAENIDEQIWNYTWIFGSNMSTDMTNEGLAGVAQHTLFDDYWPGATETCLWKNTIGLLTEAASANLASPVYVEPTELSASGKGLAEYKKSINMPLPWNGGQWGLEDIVKYELSSTLSIIKTSYLHKNEILKLKNDLAKKDVLKGKTIAPYFYILPENQKDQSELVDLVNLMKEHGINVYKLKSDIIINNRTFYKNDIVIPLAQPFRAFIKEVMEKQVFPLRHYLPGKEPIRPYDISSWSLPLHRGIESIEINTYDNKIENNLEIIEKTFTLNDYKTKDSKYVVLLSTNNHSYKAAFSINKLKEIVYRNSKEIKKTDTTISAGSFIFANNKNTENIIKELNFKPLYIENLPENLENVKFPKIGLVETFRHDMDAGWTRFIFDSYNIPFTVINPHNIEKLDLSQFTVIIFPNSNPDVLMTGKSKFNGESMPSNYPPEFAKGMGATGFQNLTKYIVNGGKIIAWGESVKLFDTTFKVKNNNEEEEFRLPFTDLTSQMATKGNYVPGSLVKLNLIENHPLTYGLSKQIGIFYRGRHSFNTSIPSFDTDRKVIGVFPETDILISGYEENIKTVGNKAALIWLKKAKGELIFFAFNPQFRALTQGSYKLLFNSLLL